MEKTNCNGVNNVAKSLNDESKVWRLIDTQARTRKEVNKKISIENIPEDRYDEALDFLCDYYIPDEPICQCMKVTNDQAAIYDFRREWRNVLEEGLSIGAFLIDPDLRKSQMVGVNVLYIGSSEKDATVMQKNIFNSETAEKMVEMFVRVQDEANVCEKYDTKMYIGAIGLAVHPHYRGLGLAKYILDARTEIGRKLEIRVTVTNFTGPLSQLAAERAGFEVLFEQRYEDMLDDNGKVMFPVETSKTIRVMGKRLY